MSQVAELFPVKLSPVTKPASRVCLRCSRTYPLAVFARGDKSTRLTSEWCLACEVLFKKERDAKKADSKALNSHKRRKWKRSLPADVVLARKAKALWSAARTRAWRHSVPFDLPEGWVVDKLVNGVCDVTGLTFHIAPEGSRHNFCPSIDRHEGAKGYTEENCRMVVWIYNAAKGAGGHEDVVRLARALIDRNPTTALNLDLTPHHG